MTIRPATPSDAEAIAAIYNYYVTQTIVTFEEETVAPSEMLRRMEEVQLDAEGNIPTGKFIDASRDLVAIFGNSFFLFGFSRSL